MILKAKEGLELEKKHREDLQKKALASKTMRDKILMEAALKKGKDQSKTKEEEANHVKKLYIEIQTEKSNLRAKKEKERQAARLVIQENEVEKKKRFEQETEDKKTA